MQFEYEIRLKDGRLVNVTGSALIAFGCDSDDFQAHIEDIEIESATQVLNGTDEWLELELGARTATELQNKIESKIYSELAAA